MIFILEWIFKTKNRKVGFQIAPQRSSLEFCFACVDQINDDLGE